jgi:hypothetical protein
MFSLREYLIKLAENSGSTISYDERLIHETIQAVYRASLTWAKGMKLKDICDQTIPKSLFSLSNR